MITEIAQIEVAAGQEAAFEAAASEAVALFKAAKGCHHMRIERSIEHPSRYRLFVAWESLEAHVEDFRNSPEFGEWRKLVGPYFASPPAVEHTSVVISGF